MKSIHGALWAFCLAMALPAAPVNYRPLPITNLNEAAGDDRSNISFAESDSNFMNGDDFSLLSGFAYRINSITVYSVASILGDALGNEFSGVSFWGRATGGILMQMATGSPDTFFTGSMVGNSNPNIRHEQVQYANGEDYEAAGFTGAFFPIWATTFSNLNWVVNGGTTYEYAVQGIGATPDAQTFYGYWFNHASNPLLSGTVLNSADGRFRVFDVNNPAAASALTNPVNAGLWNKTADMNLVMDVEVIGRLPEPGTWTLFGIGLAGIAIARVRARK